MSDPYPLWGTRGSWANYEVVGEWFHQDDLRAVIHLDPLGEQRWLEEQHVASLVPDPDNPKDRNAISVRVAGRVVGYLAAEDLPRYKPAVDRVVASGFTPTVPARIWASNEVDYEWDESTDDYVEKVTGLNARVSLALAEPHLLVPVNDPPSEPYSILPSSGSVQVTGEQNHFDVLAEFVRPEGDVLAIATLHEIEEQLTRSSRTIVEVRLDGRRVGTLTPKMSGQFLPAIRHMRDRGLGTAAGASVKASDVAAEVTLQAVRAHELDSGWLNGPAVTVPRLLPEGASHTVPKSFTR